MALLVFAVSGWKTFARLLNVSAMDRLRPSRITWIIMLGITLWGGFHTWGAAVGPNGHRDWRALKGLVIAVCVALFLGFWGLMLGIRRRRVAQQAADKAAAANPTPPVATTAGQ
ncbi:MAG: hypothetical protein CMJ75_04305 [Planctomycetaceae bacterium]|nr:hypothetical protein [Planctomycetaceae bacterium]